MLASSSCYGIPKKLPIKENSLIKPEYPYALTKNLGENLVLRVLKVYGMNNISARLFKNGTVTKRLTLWF